jgi:arsenite oxidase small subunit
MGEAKNQQGNLRKFTSAELQQFDGQNGHPLYVVFKSKVYDLSSSKLWPQGKHMGTHTRKENLVEAIKSAPHSEDNIFRFPVAGEFIEEVLQLPASSPLENTPIQQPTTPTSQISLNRRNFLKLAAAAGGVVTIAAVASSIKAATFVPISTTQVNWPTVTVANLNQVELLTPISFNYPLTNTPNVLVKLGVAATNGVGPDGDIVAFSTICQHLGCPYSFVPPGASPVCNASYKATFPMGYCCCHGSQYDFVHGGKVIGGPAPRPVPMVQLQFDAATGNINAVGMMPPTIFGHGPPGTTDPALVMQFDLQGGDVVTQATIQG